MHLTNNSNIIQYLLTILYYSTSLHHFPSFLTNFLKIYFIIRISLIKSRYLYRTSPLIKKHFSLSLPLLKSTNLSKTSSYNLSRKSQMASRFYIMYLYFLIPQSSRMALKVLHHFQDLQSQIILIIKFFKLLLTKYSDKYNINKNKPLIERSKL